jgi:hypothetical protein
MDLIRSGSDQLLAYLNALLNIRFQPDQKFVSRNKKFWEELISYFPLIRYEPDILK